MPDRMNKVFKPVVWLFYLLIVFEIIYMISPFALYYYSSYGPALNFLHQWPLTAWLTGFFLPHYTETSLWLLNHVSDTGEIIFLAGLFLFLTGAAQIYYSKLFKKEAVTAGLYRFIRHPQYTAFSIMGLGVLLIWPRYLVLIMYITMLFIYYHLARHEEKECSEKFGDKYKSYLKNTSMFLPGDLRILNKINVPVMSRPKRIITGLSLYGVILLLALTIVFYIRDYSLRHIATIYSRDEATVSVVLMSESEMRNIMNIALKSPEVERILTGKGYRSGSKFLNYIVPQSWYLADLPLEERPEGIDGHHQPKDFNREKYKVLFTKAKLYSQESVEGSEIIKFTYGRDPLVVVKVDSGSGKISSIEIPPAHVLWGDIPTPLF